MICTVGILNGDLIKVELVHFIGQLVIIIRISFFVILFVGLAQLRRLDK